MDDVDNNYLKKPSIFISIQSEL